MKKFLGYTIVNTKTKNFVDYDGTEYPDSFHMYETREGTDEVLEEINHYVSTYNNKHSRKVAQMRKHMKIGKVFVET